MERNKLNVTLARVTRGRVVSGTQDHINGALDPSVIDKNLIPSLEEDRLIQAHGQLEDARSLPQEMRNPVILPCDHLLDKLALRHLHNKRVHCGYKSLIHEARRKYWIIGLSSMSKALTAKCITFWETSKETAGPANEADTVFTSGNRFSSLFQHRQ